MQNPRAFSRSFLAAISAAGLLLTLGCEAESGAKGKGNGSSAQDGAGTWDTDGDGLPDLNIAQTAPKGLLDGQCDPAKIKLFGANTAGTDSCKGKEGGLAEALQKALWFFRANESGEKAVCSYVQWRGKSHESDSQIELSPEGTDMSQEFIDTYRAALDPDGNGKVNLWGGFYDAGDFIKFDLTQGYAATTLAWSMREFPSAYRDTGLWDEGAAIVRSFADYFMQATFLDENGKAIAHAHQVGAESDHGCGWMPPELRRPDFCPRKGFFATTENPAADVTAEAAAALASAALIVGQDDKEYGLLALKYAKALYELAKVAPTSTATAAGGLYVSEASGDDSAWAAIWIFEAEYVVGGATPESFALAAPYLLEAGSRTETARTGFFVSSKFLGSNLDDGWDESHTQCWNTQRPGVLLRLARIYGWWYQHPELKLADGSRPGWLYGFSDQLRIMADTHNHTWAGRAASGYGGGDATKGADEPSVGVTPDGFSIKDTWGSARYTTAAEFVALVYAKYYPSDPNAQHYQEWGKRQTAYLMGDNEIGKSYIVGLGQEWTDTPHHAASHTSLNGDLNDPVDQRHILWGALVSGPAGADGSHVDDRTDYGSNEVTIDYNASLVASLAAQYALQKDGSCPLSNFPPIEPDGDEYYSTGKISSAGNCNYDVTVTVVNATVHPPRYDENLTARFYFDASEYLAAGGKIEDLKIEKVYDAQKAKPAKVTGPIPCSDEAGNSTFYVEISHVGVSFWGLNPVLDAPRTVQLRVGVADRSGCAWDKSNDFSFVGLGSDKEEKTEFIPVYSSDKLVWGSQPACATVNDPPPPPDPGTD